MPTAARRALTASGALERDQPNRGGLALVRMFPELFAEVCHPAQLYRRSVLGAKVGVSRGLPFPVASLTGSWPEHSSV
jgi:hypothetical protein